MTGVDVDFTNGNLDKIIPELPRDKMFYSIKNNITIMRNRLISGCFDMEGSEAPY